MGVSFVVLESDYRKCLEKYVVTLGNDDQLTNSDVEWSTSLEANVTSLKDFDLHGFYHYQITKSEFTKLGFICRACICKKSTRTYFSVSASSLFMLEIAKRVWKLFSGVNDRRYINFKLVCCFQPQEDCYLYFVFYFSDNNTEVKFVEFLRRCLFMYEASVMNLFGHLSEIKTFSVLFLPAFEEGEVD